MYDSPGLATTGKTASLAVHNGNFQRRQMLVFLEYGYQNYVYTSNGSKSKTWKQEHQWYLQIQVVRVLRASGTGARRAMSGGVGVGRGAAPMLEHANKTAHRTLNPKSLKP